MNIFVFDLDPVKAATYFCDKHVVKMPLETAQMMCTALTLKGVSAPYKPCHVNHPCSIWVRQNKSNFTWLYNHGKSICAEYTKRYGKIHKSEAIIDLCFTFIDHFEDGDITPFAMALPAQYKSDDVVESYRIYFINDKKHIFQWKNCEPPYWIKK